MHTRTLTRRLTAIASGLMCAITLSSADGRTARQPPAADIDRLAGRAMQEFSVPGLAIGIVKDGRLVFAKGYGTREVGQKAPIDADTLFAIGSNTKEFTAASLAILVDEGKLHWDDRIIDYLPNFRLWDPYVTREFTIRDLLTHRSGLGIGAGDLMFVTATDFTRVRPAARAALSEARQQLPFALCLRQPVVRDCGTGRGGRLRPVVGRLCDGADPEAVANGRVRGR
jgi:CubicO group peptidase (beta-lactamase class C family)